jgi:signal transduction histidine kinase
MASYFQNMDDALEQVKAVLAEVLQYNKLETGELVNTPRCLDLLGQIDQTVKMACKGAQVPLERVRLSLDVQTSQLMCDPFLLEQVLRNLLTNAVKYGLGKPVFLRAVADEDRLSIEVEDQGLGVSDDLLERLFQPFARGANAAHLPGTGLGLSIAHRAASVMGGELRLLRSNNTGSVFGLSLPVQPCSPGPI